MKNLRVVRYLVLLLLIVMIFTWVPYSWGIIFGDRESQQIDKEWLKQRLGFLKKDSEISSAYEAMGILENCNRYSGPFDRQAKRLIEKITELAYKKSIPEVRLILNVEESKANQEKVFQLVKDFKEKFNEETNVYYLIVRSLKDIPFSPEERSLLHEQILERFRNKFKEDEYNILAILKTISPKLQLKAIKKIDPSFYFSQAEKLFKICQSYPAITEIIYIKSLPEVQFLFDLEQCEFTEERLRIIKKFINSQPKPIKFQDWDNLEIAIKLTKEDKKAQELILKIDSPDFKWAINSVSREFSHELNQLHDQGKYQEQKKMLQKLSPLMFYYMIAQGQELYTSSFQLIYGYLKEELEKEKITLRQYLEEIDPNREFAAKFILTMSYFDRLGDLLTKEESSFWATAFLALLCDNSKYQENAFFLMPTIEKVFSSRIPGFKEIFEEALITKYQSCVSSDFQCLYADLKMILEIIIWKFRDKFSPKHQETVHKIASKVNYIPPLEIPYQDWFTKKRSTLTVQLYFYPGHESHLAELSQLAIDQKFEVVEKKYEKKKLKELILEKKVNQTNGSIRLIRIINTITDYPNAKEAIENPDIQTIGHRGHSFELDDTFWQSAKPPYSKLLFFGSCGGFRDIPGIVKLYGGKGAQFIATLGTGKGSVNNRLLLYVLNQIAFNSPKTWSMIRKALPPNLKDATRDYVFPDELPMVILYQSSQD